MARFPSVELSIESVISTLQRCRTERNVRIAREIHLYLCEHGLDSHGVLGNHLVPTFIQCESLSDAQLAFDRLPHRREVSWTSLIQGYVELGEAKYGLRLFGRMQENFVYPSEYTFPAVLRACAKLGCIERGRDLHSNIIKNGLDDNIFIGNTLVDMYGKCGSLLESQGVFDLLPSQDLVSWNALLTGYAEKGFAKETIACFERLHTKGLSPDATTFLCVLKACSTIQAEDFGKEVHAMILKEELEQDDFVGNTLVDMYAKCGLLKEAWDIFKELSSKDLVSWNALITGHTENAHYEEVLSYWQEMQIMGISPNTGTFVRILQACSALGEAGRGQESHSEIVERGVEDEYFVGNTLVDMYSKCGLLEDAQNIFDNFPLHDSVSWNALLAGYSSTELREDTLMILQEMQYEGVSPDSVTFCNILKACSSLGDLEKGRQIHTEIIKMGFEDRFSGSSLVDLYAKCNSLHESRNVFEKILDRDVVCWNVLISGYVDQELDKEALDCVEQMQYEGISLDPGTYVCVLQLCEISVGQALHMDIILEEYDVVPSVSCALVNMYVRNGLSLEAHQVFDEQSPHDVISWTALVAGYIEDGLNEEALNCLEQMQMEGVSPNNVTYVCLLKACKLEFLDNGRKLHAAIVGKGAEGDSLIGTSLISMYAECGNLVEAQEMLDKTLVGDVFLWTTLAAGYIDHGRCKEALTCLENMQENGISPDPLTYVCALQACCGLKTMDMGQILYSAAVKKGFEQDLGIGNALIELYSNCSMLRESQKVVEGLPIRDLVSWTLLIRGYTEHGLMEDASNCLYRMQFDGITPDVVAWNMVILGVAEQDYYEKPIELCAQMQEQGVLPDSAIFLNVVMSCRKVLAVGMGKRVHAQVMKLSESEKSKGTFENALVDMYGKFGSVSDAEQVFQSMSSRDKMAWNGLLIGYALQGNSKVVFLLFEQMIKEDICPDGDSFCSIFIVCSHAGLLLESQCYHDFMKECFGIISTIKHLTCFVDLLARAGLLDCARFMLEMMPFQPDLVLLHAMLNACRMLGDVDFGHEIFSFAKNLDRRHAAAYILMSNIYSQERL